MIIVKNIKKVISCRNCIFNITKIKVKKGLKFFRVKLFESKSYFK